MLVFLTDLFDCRELPWKYRTKGRGDNTIENLYLNLLAATTPDSLASSLPALAIGGGLTSRILFIEMCFIVYKLIQMYEKNLLKYSAN